MHKIFTTISKDSFTQSAQKISFICVVTLTSPCLIANEITFNYSQLEQKVTFQENATQVSPSGVGAALAYELNNDWTVAVNYQKWHARHQSADIAKIETDITDWGTSLSYFQDQWFISSALSFAEDDLSIQGLRRANNFQTEKSKINSVALTAGYNWYQNSWLYDVNLTLQHSQWDMNVERSNNRFENEELHRGEVTIQKTTNNSSHINLGSSISHYWSLAGDKGILAGLMISWTHTLSGDDVFSDEQQNVSAPTRPTTRQGQQRSNTLTSPVSFGDDSYGQLSFYLSYDLGEKWAVDFDLAQSIASEDDSKSWLISSSYYF